VANGETWLVCGGRNFSDRDVFDEAMLGLMRNRGLPSRIVHGGAKGADAMAAQVAAMMSIPCVAVLPDWSRGKIAGPLRNQKMLDEYKPHVVLALPGGRGTADMVSRARKSVPIIIEVKPNS
jgi:hypothetical protein